MYLYIQAQTLPPTSQETEIVSAWLVGRGGIASQDHAQVPEAYGRDRRERVALISRMNERKDWAFNLLCAFCHYLYCFTIILSIIDHISIAADLSSPSAWLISGATHE